MVLQPFKKSGGLCGCQTFGTHTAGKQLPPKQLSSTQLQTNNCHHTQLPPTQLSPTQLSPTHKWAQMRLKWPRMTPNDTKCAQMSLNELKWAWMSLNKPECVWWQLCGWHCLVGNSFRWQFFVCNCVDDNCLGGNCFPANKALPKVFACGVQKIAYGANAASEFRFPRVDEYQVENVFVRFLYQTMLGLAWVEKAYITSKMDKNIS